MRIFFSILLITGIISACSSRDENILSERKPGSLLKRKSDSLFYRPELQEIVKIQNLRDAEALVPYFYDIDPSVRARAAFAMASVQDSTVKDHLINLLKDNNEDVRLDAAFAVRQNLGKVEPGILVNLLLKENSLRVKAMILTAIGFNGNYSDYEDVMKMDLPDLLEHYQALCAIYSLENNVIVSDEGINKMLEIIDTGTPNSKEAAAYFFLSLRRNNIVKEELVVRLRDKINKKSLDDMAIPFLLSYVSSYPMPSDTSIYLKFSRHGKDLRTRSIATEHLGFYSQYPIVRQELIHNLAHEEFQVALAASYAVSDCMSLSNGDLGSIKDILSSGSVSFNIVPYALNSLYNYGEEDWVSDYLERISPEGELELAVAISGLENIDVDKIRSKAARLLMSDNRQVSLIMLEYLSSRLNGERSTDILELFNNFFLNSPHIRIKSDAILSVAHNMKSQFSDDFRKKLFLQYYTLFRSQGDYQSAAMCLIVLGDLQDESLKPLFKNSLADSSQLISLSSAGAQEILSMARNDRIDVYRNEMLYSPTLNIDWDLLAKYGRFPRFRFRTRQGDILIEVDAEQAPMGVQNLIEHINSGLMDSIYIYRIELNHVTQFGTPGHSRFRVLNEITRIPKYEASCGIGHLGKDTGSQHIAIAHLMRPHNEGKYTTFGIVIEGQELVRSVERYELIISSNVIPQ